MLCDGKTKFFDPYEVFSITEAGHKAIIDLINRIKENKPELLEEQ